MIKKGLGITGLITAGLILLRLLIPVSKPIQSQTRFLMDTICTIQVPGNKEVIEVIEKAFERIEEIDEKFNALNPESPVYKFNNNDIPITDREIVDLVRTALLVSGKSEGKFDITIFPLIKLWGFFGESPKVPENEKIVRLLKTVGYENIYVENGKLLKKKDDVRIDLGSIAKGYAIAEAKKVLEQAGIKSALIDAGGDIYAHGTNYGKPWVIGIRNPRGDGVVGSLELSNMAVITSGDYERVFEEDGVKYHHILNPETGFPAEGIASITVISPDPTLADAWSTAFFVLGKEKTMKILKSMKSTEIFMITCDGENFHSTGMQVEAL